MTTISQTIDRPRVEVMLRGRLPYRVRDYAIAKMTALMRLAPHDLTVVRVKISRAQRRVPEEDVVVEVNLQARGRSVRVQVAASTGYEAIDLAQERLRRKLSQLGQPPARSNGRARAHRPGYLPRAADEREVVRHKAYAPALAAVDEAIFDLEMMDYDFQLFTELLSGVDSVVYRDGEHGYRLARLDGNASPTNSTGVAMVDAGMAPRLTLEQAADAMEAGPATFVFFANPHTGRGNVLYRRHDGHYGLITPAD